MLKQVHVYIKGDVIGVGFRAWTKIQAKLHNVHGWVRNVFDEEHIFGKSGGVEAVFQGDEDDVEAMVQEVKKGPSVARVDEVEVIHLDPKEVFEMFEIRK